MRRFVLIAVLFLAVPALVAHADDDREELSAAARSGPLLPLAEILGSVAGRIDGRIADIEFEQEHGRPIYEIYWIDKNGRRRELHVDARDGRVLSDEKDE
jgi:uncharacterized membrane protein YkoI